MFILKKGHQPGVYVPLRALFLVHHKIHTFYIVQCVSDIEAWINISLFQEMKVVMLEDLAAHFKLKTQVSDWCG